MDRAYASVRFALRPILAGAGRAVSQLSNGRSPTATAALVITLVLSASALFLSTN